MKQDDTSISVAELTLYLEDALSVTRAAQIRQSLASNRTLRATLAEIEAVRTALAVDEPTMATVDVAPAVLQAIQDERQRMTSIATTWWSRRLVWSVAGTSALAAAAGLVVYLATAPRDDEFTARGGPASGIDSRWTALTAFRSDPTGQVITLEHKLGAADALLFTYTNRGREPFDFLMVFAVDARGEVYWYYPAHLDATADPGSIAIAAGANSVELGDAVRHRLPAGPLKLIGLFSRAPFTVPAIERMVRGQNVRAGLPGQLQAPATSQHVIELEVLP